MPDGEASSQILWVQERVCPRVLGNRQGVGVVRTKVDGVSQGTRYGKVLKIVQVIGLIKKRKMKMKIKSPVLKVVRSRKLRQHLLPEGQCAGQPLRPPRPDAVAALGGEQQRRKTVATDQSPDGRVVTGDVRPQLRDGRLDEELLVEPRPYLRREDRCCFSIASVAVVSCTQSVISFQRILPKTVPKAAPISSCRFFLLPDPLCVPPVCLLSLSKCGQSLTPTNWRGMSSAEAPSVMSSSPTEPPSDDRNDQRDRCPPATPR